MADISEVLRLGDRITVLPVVHGSGDFTVEVRRRLLAGGFDAVAVPLPPSFQQPVEAAIQDLPVPTLVLQPEQQRQWHREWSPEADEQDDHEDDDTRHASYVPVDPCQPVIAALRWAMGEHVPRAFIDLETDRFEAYTAVMPDPYALKHVALERFAAAVLPSLARPKEAQRLERIATMASRLRLLEEQFERIAFVCSLVDWPWIREAYHERFPAGQDEASEDPCIYQVNERTLVFFLGELPYITGLYEKARAELEDDENLSVDGVKQLLLAARHAYREEMKTRARKISPQTLKLYLKYVRNLSLIEHRMTPDLFTLVTAADQIMGDRFALHVAETARSYPDLRILDYPTIDLGIGKGRTPDGTIYELTSRLPGVPMIWRNCQLQSRPDKKHSERWQVNWNPFGQCSWPPEDAKIEEFRTRVAERAQQMIGMDLAKNEKFTTSLKDGLDIRETLRNWHTGDLYVKEFPPSLGKLDCVVMFFDTPADPRNFPWRTTWFAEHQNESTLCFYASNYLDDMVGPGIGRATYGGALFLFPPRHLPDIWTDHRLDFASTLEERLLAAACRYSESRHIAFLSPVAPGAAWRSLARRFKKNLVHVPLGQFGASTIEMLRTVHVLNGRHVRSYAADFIRKG